MPTQPPERIPFPDDDLPAYLTRRRRRSGRRGFLRHGFGAAAFLAAPAFVAEALTAATVGAVTAVPTLPVYARRSEWGADETLRWDSDGRETFPPRFFPLQGITIHHTGGWTPADEEDAAAILRDVYQAHTVALDYGDIGYQLAIGPEGYVYEGRWSGGTNFPVYDIEPSAGTPSVVQGAHIGGYNACNVGIVLLGDYSEETPTDPAWWALTAVVAMLSGNAGKNPRSRIHYVNPINGNEIDVPLISVHEQWADTECPGQGVRSELPWLRNAAAAWTERYGTGYWFQ